MQSDLVVEDGAITGTLKFIDSGPIASVWEPGNFMALQFADIDEDATSVLVGLEPSVSSGLVELIDDPDKNGVFKVTDKDAQKFVVIQSCNGVQRKQEFDLSGLTLLDE